jgi:hypothetical protein
MIEFRMTERATESEKWLKRSPCKRCNCLDESTWYGFDGNFCPSCEIHVVDIVFRQSYSGINNGGSNRKVFRDCPDKDYTKY